MKLRRIAAIGLVVVVVVLVVVSTRSPADKPPERSHADLVAMGVTSCGGVPVDYVADDGTVFCQPDQVNPPPAPPSFLWWSTVPWWVTYWWAAIPLILMAYVLMSLPFMWNERAG